MSAVRCSSCTRAKTQRLQQQCARIGRQHKQIGKSCSGKTCQVAMALTARVYALAGNKIRLQIMHLLAQSAMSSHCPTSHNMPQPQAHQTCASALTKSKLRTSIVSAVEGCDSERAARRVAHVVIVLKLKGLECFLISCAAKRAVLKNCLQKRCTTVHARSSKP